MSIQTAMKNQQHKNSFSLRTSFSELDRKFPLSSFVYNKSEAWYDAKHKSFSIDEIALVNSLEVKQCPYCYSETIKKNGKRKDGTQRYHCLSCRRGFNPLTGSLFDSRKIPVAEWIEFLVHLFQYESLSISSLDNRNVRSTGRYWIKKVFEALKHYQDGIMLGNVFWIDETFVKKKPADTVKAQNGKHIKGISRNLICVATATDGYNSVLYVVGSGKPSSSKLIKAMEGHLKDGARMIDDDEVAHSLLASRFDLIRETHPTKETKGMSDKENPMDMVNRLHRFFKRYMSRHGSYDRDDIQDWCNLFSFIWNHHGNVAEAVVDFLEIAISTKKIIKYRSVMGKKT